MDSLNIEFFGYFAAILTTAAFLPQLIKTLKTKKVSTVYVILIIPLQIHNVFLQKHVNNAGVSLISKNYFYVLG